MARSGLKSVAQGFNQVSTLGTLKINEFALKKGREADLVKLAPIAAPNFRVVSAFDLPPLQGESLWAAVPRVETRG